MVEALLLVSVIPVFWFPLRWPALTLAALPVLPITWIARRRLGGRLSLGAGMEMPLLLLLLCTCLTGLPVFAIDLATPKILGLAVGAAVLIAAQRTAAASRDTGRIISGLALLTLGLASLGAVGVEWPAGKIPVLEPVVDRLPVVIRGIVPNTTRGGINPNELAGVLALLVPPLFAATLVALGRGETWGRTVLYGLSALVGGLALAATQSRGALLGTAVACALLLTILPRAGLLTRVPRTWARAAALSAWLVVVGASAWGLRNLLRTGRTEATANVADTLAGRAEIWNRSISMLWDFPLTGIGLGQFDPVLHWLYPPTLLAAEFVPHAHNLYLAYGVELGLPGALSVGWLLFVFFRQSRRAARGVSAPRRLLGLGVAAGMVAFLVFGITDAISPGARGGLMFWLVLGLGAGSHQPSPPSAAAPPAEVPAPR